MIMAEYDLTDKISSSFDKPERLRFEAIESFCSYVPEKMDKKWESEKVVPASDKANEVKVEQRLIDVVFANSSDKVINKSDPAELKFDHSNNVTDSTYEAEGCLESQTDFGNSSESTNLGIADPNLTQEAERDIQTSRKRKTSKISSPKKSDWSPIDNTVEIIESNLNNSNQDKIYSWYDGFRLPLGADGRQILLRKLRKVYHQNGAYWDKYLCDKGLQFNRMPYATVSDLFKIAFYLNVFDFAVKCSSDCCIDGGDKLKKRKRYQKIRVPVSEECLEANYELLEQSRKEALTDMDCSNLGNYSRSGRRIAKLKNYDLVVDIKKNRRGCRKKISTESKIKNEDVNENTCDLNISSEISVDKSIINQNILSEDVGLSYSSINHKGPGDKLVEELSEVSQPKRNGRNSLSVVSGDQALIPSRPKRCKTRVKKYDDQAPDRMVCTQGKNYGNEILQFIKELKDFPFKDCCKVERNRNDPVSLKYLNYNSMNISTTDNLMSVSTITDNSSIAETCHNMSALKMVYMGILNEQKRLRDWTNYSEVIEFKSFKNFEALLEGCKLATRVLQAIQKLLSFQRSSCSTKLVPFQNLVQHDENIQDKWVNSSEAKKSVKKSTIEDMLSMPIDTQCVFSEALKQKVDNKFSIKTIKSFLESIEHKGLETELNNRLLNNEREKDQLSHLLDFRNADEYKKADNVEHKSEENIPNLQFSEEESTAETFSSNNSYNKSVSQNSSNNNSRVSSSSDIFIKTEATEKSKDLSNFKKPHEVENNFSKDQLSWLKDSCSKIMKDNFNQNTPNLDNSQKTSVED